MAKRLDFSPCMSMCQVDKDSKYCVSCHRTLEELKNFRYMTEVERRLNYAKAIKRRIVKRGGYRW